MTDRQLASVVAVVWLFRTGPTSTFAEYQINFILLKNLRDINGDEHKIGSELFMTVFHAVSDVCKKYHHLLSKAIWIMLCIIDDFTLMS